MTHTHARVIVPWPPSGLSPNGSQGDYRGKARLASAYKARCALLMMEKGRAVKRLPPGSVVQRVIVVACPPPKVSRYDFDNLARRLKPAFDALAAALGVDDGDWRVMVFERGERSRDGGVILQVEVTE